MNYSWRFRIGVKTTTVTALLVCASALALDRPADPVILTGADIPSLINIAPEHLVAFRYAGGWHQIPVQVDERDVIDFTNVYEGDVVADMIVGLLKRLDYTDAGTFTGPDSDPALDADDEIVFMAKDAGQQPAALAGLPPNVFGDSAVEVAITDPLGSAPGFVYLFEQNGALDPSAGVQYVDYNFNLLSGGYKETYNVTHGWNPEDSTITTPAYKRHFSDRWICDGLHVFAGNATGVDILDRHKNMFGPGSCGRSENSFSQGEGAFIINKNGPVRAIRSYVGANSGPRTQRQHLYYESREDIRTFLRVHAIPGVMDFFDYSAAAIGMTYFNNNALAGVTIDGIPDTVPAGPLQWELIRGPQGSLAIIHLFLTDITGYTPTSYYLDNANPSVTQCTGDSHAYGSSGHWWTEDIPNTDTIGGPAPRFEAVRILYYAAPGLTIQDTQNLRSFIDQPLTTTCHAWRPYSSETLPTLDTIGAILLTLALLGARSRIAKARTTRSL